MNIRRSIPGSCVAIFVSLPLLVAGCFDPENNPLAALSAVEKIEGAVASVEAGADPFGTLKATVASMTASELASAANIIGGLDLSLGDAQQILDLVWAIDEQTLAHLEEVDVDITDPNTSVEEIVAALHDAGVESVTASQVELLEELLGIFAA